MQRFKTSKTEDPFAYLPERGKSREEHYEPGVKEPFGLNKRSRRATKGVPVTLPNEEPIKS